MMQHGETNIETDRHVTKLSAILQTRQKKNETWLFMGPKNLSFFFLFNESNFLCKNYDGVT